MLLQILSEQWGEKYLHIFKYSKGGFKIHFAVFSLSFPLKLFYLLLHMHDTYLSFPLTDDLNILTKLGNQQKCQNH
jgi:hypothetical protein